MNTIVWIGLASTDKIFEQLAKKGYFHAPTHNAQKNIITGIEEYLGQPMDTINGFMMPSIPKCPELITKGMRWSHRNGAMDVSVTSINIRYLDFIFRKLFMKAEGKKWAKNQKEQEVTVFVYAASEPYITAALEIKKIISHAHICLIIPDLPQYMELNGSRFKQKLKNMRWKKLYRLICQCDSYILFTKHMAKYLQIENRQWMVMEGSVNVKEQILIDPQKSSGDDIIIMYSGAIDNKYGIPELLCAFKLIPDSNYRLWFTGTGNADQLVLDAEKKDTRIKHYGFLSDRLEVLNLQQQATMLITTRMPTEVASAYCFPSKIFEYLLSGKPVLSFKIPGIPEEYFDYMIEMKSVDVEDIKESIIKVGTMTEDERKYIGNSGREFVLKEKNYYKQGKRICEFLNLRPYNN